MNDLRETLFRDTQILNAQKTERIMSQRVQQLDAKLANTAEVNARAEESYEAAQVCNVILYTLWSVICCGFAVN